MFSNLSTKEKKMPMNYTRYSMVISAILLFNVFLEKISEARRMQTEVSGRVSLRMPNQEAG